MKLIQRTIGITLLSAILALTSGCNTPGQGAAAGGIFGGALGTAIGAATHHPELGAAIGVAAGMTAGAIIGSINEQQRATLQAQSPQTLQTIQHNDQIYQQQQQAAQAQQQGQPPQAQTQVTPAEALTPLTVDDIKALDSAGVKKEVIIAEIGRSKSTYTPADITALQQSNPNIDPSVIDCMKKTVSS
jgi:outer membrane lipoprotein SlyB